MEPLAARPLLWRVHPGWHVLGALAVGVWALVMALKFMGAGEAQAVPLSMAGAAQSFVEDDEWMGIYQKGRRLGQVHSVARREAGGIRFEQTSELALQVAGSHQKISTTLRASLSSQLALEEFELRIETGLMSSRVRGRVEGDRLRVEVALGKDQLSREWKLAEPPLLPFLLPRLLAREDLQPGRRFKTAVFDPQTLSNQPQEIEVVGPEALATARGMIRVFHLKRKVMGQDVETWIDGQGRVLKEVYAIGLTMNREEGPAADTAQTPAAGDAGDATGILPHLFPDLGGLPPSP